jgi:glycosyltransferase involved in cell wall biosynthesis
VTAPRRLAVIFDATEERWPSMEYSAEMLLKHLEMEHGNGFASTAIRPKFFRGFERLPLASERQRWNLGRVTTRFLSYPLQLRALRRRFDFFHIADHTYANLALWLPQERSGVFCHDLDAFEPALNPRGHETWRVAMARLQLAGFKRAARVFYSTEQLREQLVTRGIVPPARLVQARLGVAEEFWRPVETDLPEEARGFPYLLNVAGNFPRKRLDILFRIFAGVTRRFPAFRLVQHGAELNESQRQLTRELGISERIVSTPPVSRAALAALYRHCALLLLPSDREGFGFPAVEGLAAGAVVVLSDIPAFREVAGEAAVFCPPGDVTAWIHRVTALLDGSESGPPPDMRRSRAQCFSWEAHAASVAAAYSTLGVQG